MSILTIPPSALVKAILGPDASRGVQVLDRRPSSQSLHVVTREGAEVTGPLAGTDVPSVVALLHYVHRVALLQLQLVVVLRLVIIQRPISVKMQILVSPTITLSITNDWCTNKRQQSKFIEPYKKIVNAFRTDDPRWTFSSDICSLYILNIIIKYFLWNYKLLHNYCVHCNFDHRWAMTGFYALISIMRHVLFNKYNKHDNVGHRWSRQWMTNHKINVT